MKLSFSLLVTLGAFICGISHAARLDSNNEDEVRQFVNESSKNLNDIFNKIADAFKGLGEETSASTVFETILVQTDAVVKVVRNASTHDHTKYNDPELNYILEKLKFAADEAILGRGRYFQILKTMIILENLASNKNIKKYKNKRVKLAYFPAIQNIIAKSSDPEEIKYYWNAWREKNEERVVTNLMALVDDLKEAANATGISAFDFWMKDFNLTQMDSVMAQLQPAYRQIHGFIRHQLNKKYGDAVINKQGLIPDHLFKQVLAQTWTSEGLLEEMFPFKDLPHYDEELLKKNFDTLQLYKTADKFYETMGFEKIPESYWGKNLKMKSDDDEGDCKATILALNANVVMQYCQKMNFRAFLQAHGYMAELHVAMEKSHLPAYYSDSYQLEFAIGEAGILSASSPKYLNKIGLNQNAELNEQAFMNRLLRLNFHTMLNIPVYYVYTKVMADLFAGKFEAKELNKKYWELMDKYVGVGPPGDRVSNTFDFPFDFYVDFTDNLQARKFVSEVMSFQLYIQLCSIADQYPKGPLQNCDLSDSTAAGEALKKMIKLGSSKPLPEVLATLLPEDPNLNADSLLEYYFPSLNWLALANKQGNVNIGWTHLDKKVGNVKLDDYDEEYDE